MDKFEYSDLYKFLVSAGIILIALSILTPWFYLKEPFDLLIEKTKIPLYTDDAITIIKSRQELIKKTYSYISVVSIVLLLVGLISATYGLIKWFAKQSDIDKRDLLTTKKLENEVKGMTFSEIETKNQKEFEEVESINIEVEKEGLTTTTTLPPTKDEFISSYVQMEQYLASKFSDILNKKYIVLSNKRINGYEFDLVLNSILENAPDIVFEIKYFPRGVTRSTIHDSLMQLKLLTKIYRSAIKLNTNAVLLILLKGDKINEDRFEKLKLLPAEIGIENTKIAFFNSEDIDQLDNKFFESLLK